MSSGSFYYRSDTDSETILARIREECKKYKQLEEEYKSSFNNGSNDEFYLLNKSWLDSWKRKVGYDGNPPEPKLHLERNPNEDLIIEKSESGQILKYAPLSSQMWNTLIKPHAQEGIDFEIISKEMWEFLQQNYILGPSIRRDSILIQGYRQVNVQLLRLHIAPLFSTDVARFRNGYGSILKGSLYVSRTCKLIDYIKLLQDTVQTISGHTFVENDGIRLYKAPAELNYSKLEDLIREQVKDLSYSDDPMFEVQGSEYLDPNTMETMEDCQIEPQQLILLEAKETHRSWCIKNPMFPTEGKCEGCYNMRVLQFPCECKKVSYCTEECKKKDEQYHLQRCEKTDSDTEALSKLEKTQKSIDGKCGLKNLGNTCFMNSGIQCLSNTNVLCTYLLNNTYMEDINDTNPLGTKGELCNKFAHLIRRMWYGEKNVQPPFSLKRAIGKFQPQFQGYQQHDSQELITYLLDGLHEDLNRVRVKPYVELDDSHGREDWIVAKESWDNFRKRNDSIIVDNMYGLYKSQIKCPVCDRLSITFDPYLMVSLSIPHSQSKSLSVQLITNELIWDVKSYEYKYQKTSNLKLADLFKDSGIQEFIGETDISKLAICITSSSYNDPINLEEPINEVKKKLKYKKLFVRKLHQQEILIGEESVEVLMRESYKSNSSYSWKYDITPALSFKFSQKTTGKDIHLFVFQIHINLLKCFEGLENLIEDIKNKGLEETYMSNIHEVFWDLEFKSNQRYMQDCAFCKQERCNDCKIPYNDEECVRDWIKRDKQLQIEVFVVWNKGATKQSLAEEIYNDWVRLQNNQTKSNNQEMEIQDDAKQQQKENINNINKKDYKIPDQSISLGECIEFSAQPEQLEADNTWYCKNCQDHMQAYKTLQIYKTPKILIFHLKRFKNSQKYFKSKLDTHIDFPINGLDMSKYISNVHLPSEFNNEVPQQQKDGNAIYDLYAVSNHFGGLGGGHYTAFAKNIFDNQWYNFDDSMVNIVNNPKNEIVTNAAYVLFYKKRDDNQLTNGY